MNYRNYLDWELRSIDARLDAFKLKPKLTRRETRELATLVNILRYTAGAAKTWRRARRIERMRELGLRVVDGGRP